ncbi:ras-related protein Rab-2-A-like isoform X1 [Triticum dicoccoides]|uniref:ras-related protein Rab-2-A-like isoform X1 n=1 Tax=Triticum dicoccoides TaxID=85692 RepID=UPI0018901985|nr:ras-related protein Rab-2-A-like isoform X1 [Triticum dicoccoides]
MIGQQGSPVRSTSESRGADVDLSIVAGVGKSCLEQQFTARAFPEEHEPTIGVEFGTRTIAVHDKRVKLYIWDMEGRETYVSVTQQCYYRAACIILVYDITRRETFDHIAVWLSRARKLSRAGVTLVLIGNKCDLSHMRAVGYEEGRKFAKRHKLVFMEASAKTTQNVEEAFVVTTETVYQKVEDGVIDLSEKFVGFLHMPENITPSQSGGVAGSSYGRSNCCLVWCRKLACQYAGKAKKWLSIGWQPSYFANLSKLGNFCQALELPNVGMPICWLANFWLSAKHALNSWRKNGATVADEAEKPNDRFMC